MNLNKMMKFLYCVFFGLLLILMALNLENNGSEACGLIASGCKGECSNDEHCEPFWGGRCACFSKKYSNGLLSRFIQAIQLKHNF